MSYLQQYESDSYLTTIQTTITQQGKDEHGSFVCLKESIIYPGGGGQPADNAWIQDIPVTKIQKKDNEVRYHLKDDVPALPQQVNVKIDWDQRFDLMQQHTGQHILARVCEDLFQVRISKEQITLTDSFFEIDTKLNEAQLNAAIARSNEIIRHHKSVAILFPTEEQLAKETLFTTPPKYFAGLRLIKIDDFDIIGCGGTHVNNTAEVQAIAFTQIKEHKKGTTLHFACGNRLLQQFESNQKQLATLSQKAQVPTTALTEAFQQQQTMLKFYQQRIATYQVQALIENANEISANFVYSEIAESDVKELQQAAGKLTAIYPSALICTATKDEENLRYHLICPNENTKLPIGQLIKVSNQKFGGRGGGSASKGDGTLPYSQKEAWLHFLQD
ncbi:alanyl-tRNA editing protein [Enterococcus dispar]|uniref:alanyl-tRNA editing protein n=1 Tax=Enterococcus dispar TaxID=44009 RepID=UPI000915AD0C|nr:DHHA1 domain-containing protein [Enterococcus dispar]MDT2706317.1 DHHA1 domain-containing protein [Enterococcus dispar]OJG39704.1 hypothetical protein RV01_GL000886 [Enterococcus dispar]WCG34205.1 DHHA1 domain-containing protein [Enterococcus dispar]